MKKRYTDANKWIYNKWFRNLKSKYKLFWMYICDNCDNVGVWEVDVVLASYLIGEEYNEDELINVFNDKILLIRAGKKWWIKDFVIFQYGVLMENNINNKPHQSYIKLLKKHSLWIEYRKGIDSLKDKDKDKDKDKEKDIYIYNNKKEKDNINNNIIYNVCNNNNNINKEEGY
jgi:hypothetical protein